MNVLTDEQKKRIEVNKQKALALRASHLRGTTINNSGIGTPEFVRDGSCWTQRKANFTPKACNAKSFSSTPTKYCSKSPLHPGQEKTITANISLVSDERFVVESLYDATLISVFKTISSRIYVVSSKSWTFDLKDYKHLVDSVKRLCTHVTLELLPRAVQNAFVNELNGKSTVDPVGNYDLSMVDNKLQNTLLPFQRDAVNFAIRKLGRVILADEMGLGKTMQAMTVAAYYRNEWPLLVVSPASVREMWAKSISNWLPSISTIEIISTSKGLNLNFKAEVSIITYDLMTRIPTSKFADIFQVVIFDEAHNMKNFKTARYKAAEPICRKAKRVLLLTGTPALSRPCELYTQVSLVSQSVFRSFHEFGIRYCGGNLNKWGWDFSGSSNVKELNLLLQRQVMIRRLKSEVLPEIHNKRRHMVTLDPSMIKITKELRSKELQVLDKKKIDKSEYRSMLLSYYADTAHSKLDAAAAYILQMLCADKELKIVVFAHHKIMLSALADALNSQDIDYILICGKTASSERQNMVDSFQNIDRIRVALLSITAANSGITLTSARAVVFAELFWNPGILNQAEDRVCRIGQQHPVDIYYLVAGSTADDHIWTIIKHKVQVLNRIGLNKEDLTVSDLQQAPTGIRQAQTTLDSFCCSRGLDKDGEEDVVDIDALWSELDEMWETEEEIGPPAKKSRMSEPREESESLVDE